MVPIKWVMGSETENFIASVETESSIDRMPAFQLTCSLDVKLRSVLQEVIDAWLQKSISIHTRKAYRHDLEQFFKFIGIDAQHCEQLTNIRPSHVALWRDELQSPTASGLQSGL